MTDRSPIDGLDAELLDRYLAGECSEAEVAVVRRHLMAHPEAARMVAQLRRALDGGAVPAPPAADGSWQRLRERMRHDTATAVAAAARREPTAPNAPRPVVRATPPEELPRIAVRGSPPPHWRRALVTLAASVLVVAGVGYGISHRGTLVGAPAGAAGATAARAYVTAPRERAELRLADGTRVRLAPGSRLRVAADFGDERRDVYLEGEGYFDVAPDARRPFTVFAGNASARDVGTAFAVRSYAEDSATQVVVREGVVALSGVGRLGAGELGRLGADGVGERRRVDVDAALGWLQGRLVFSHAPLARVLQDMRRWYDLELVVADPALLARPFTGELTDASPDAAVALVAATLALEARRERGRVVLRATAR